MIQLDGSMGEGGGQILRTALALSALTGQPFEMANIRSNRPKPGLRPQHLEGVKACARICAAQVEGAAENSANLRFAPGPVAPGRYRIEIRTAGSACLLLQTVYLPLLFAGEESQVEIRGGTHVPFSPVADYLEQQWAYWLARIGLRVSVHLKRAGFYPMGGGELQAHIEPAQGVLPLRCVERGRLTAVRVLSAACNLPDLIADRQRKRALSRLSGLEVEPAVETPAVPAFGKGTYVALTARYEQGQGCYTALGAIGKPAEKVADEAAKALKEFMAGEAVMDEHLADQTLLPLALAPEESEFTTPCVTSHLVTNAEVIRRFLPASIHIEGEEGRPGKVAVRGEGFRR